MLTKDVARIEQPLAVGGLPEVFQIRAKPIESNRKMTMSRKPRCR
jgi:hypothetical protein